MLTKRQYFDFPLSTGSCYGGMHSPVYACAVHDSVLARQPHARNPLQALQGTCPARFGALQTPLAT